MKVQEQYIDNDFDKIKEMIEDDSIEILQIVQTGLGGNIVYYKKKDTDKKMTREEWEKLMD